MRRIVVGMLVGVTIFAMSGRWLVADEAGWYSANTVSDTWAWGGANGTAGGQLSGNSGELGPSKAARIGQSGDTYPRSIIGIIKYLTGLENWAAPQAGASVSNGAEVLTSRYGG